VADRRLIVRTGSLSAGGTRRPKRRRGNIELLQRLLDEIEQPDLADRREAGDENAKTTMHTWLRAKSTSTATTSRDWLPSRSLEGPTHSRILLM
jgi:head-tail adaptor